MEGHKQLLPLLLILSLGRTVTSQNCWQCLGTGSSLESCATPGNGTVQVAYPSQAYLTQNLVNICMVKVVFNVASCPANGNCDSEAVLEQVSRGLPELELEYEMFKSGSMATNATGTVCTSNGALMTCTSLCEGNLCNAEVASTSISAYTQQIITECITCQVDAGNENFNACLMGTNKNDTEPCTAMSSSVGNTNTLRGMCVTIVNYDNSTLEPLTVHRGCGIPPSSAFFPTANVQFSTLGQCAPAVITYNQQSRDTISCVKGYVQGIETVEGPYIANYNRPAPGPMNATCLQCNAVMGDMQFATCMNPNASSTDLASMGVGESVCELGITECSTVFYYNGTTPGSTPVMVQRSCGQAQTRTQNSTEDCNTEGWFISSETCDAGVMSANSSLPCNTETATTIPEINCYTCQVQIGGSSSAFESCLNPNGTSSLVEECGCGTNACMSTTLYNANGTVIGIQRGCGNAPGTQTTPTCNYDNPSDVDTSDVMCTSQCTAGAAPCNDYNNAYTPGQGPPPSSSVFVSLSAVLLIVSMLV